MDVVFVCRGGENEELRYALRSLKNVPHDNVYLFGSAPDWYTGNLIESEQTGNKYFNVHYAMQKIPFSPVSDDFILWNDDFFCMKPTTMQYHHRGPVDDVIDWYVKRYHTSAYIRGMQKTRRWLADLKIENPLSYELHIPMVFNKDKFAQALKLAEGHVSIQMRSFYGNMFGVGGEYMDDVKIYSSKWKFTSDTWLSSEDKSFPYLYPLLDWTFRDKSEYER